MMETPEERKRRLNRERQARYREKNGAKVRQQQRNRYAAKKVLEDLGL